jgi:tetratricopeptide (TPR) repeat protein
MAELTIDQALQQGIKAHKAGKIQEADRLYTAILKAQPKHPDANHNMGVLAVSVGKVEQALPLFLTALEANPTKAQFWLSSIDALIKLDKFVDAKAVLAQAKSTGAKGDGFDKLERRLQEASKMAANEPPPQPNILDSLKLNQAIKLAKKKAKGGAPEEAKRIYQDILVKFPKNIRAIDGLKGIADGTVGRSSKIQKSLQDQLQALVTLYNEGQLVRVVEQAQALTKQYPEAFTVWNLLGASAAQIGQLDQAIFAFKRVLTIKPNYAEAHYNTGKVLKEQGKLEEAIESYKEAVAIRPNYAKAYNNMGNVLQEQGKQEEAKETYHKALDIKPDYAEVHRYLSRLTKYNSDIVQISEVEGLLKQNDLNDSDRCNLLYTKAKMQEDVGNLSAAFDSYVAGGDLRQKFLAYEFKQDEHLFNRIKKTAPQFKHVTLNVTGEPIRHTPIFIIGMPRSGTTLVEQIISSHSEVTGAGELNYTQQFGFDLTVGQKPINSETVQSFRKRYLAALAKRANGQDFITDKMPQNFRYIALICVAFPETKIVHVQRNAKATCWSNFQHYFASKDLGYSYNLGNTIRYYGLYKDLMHFWYQSYSDRIYNLNYDKLTADQEPETRKLIEHLKLDWEDGCLSPQKNNRSVRTASQQQIRKKVYTGSSQVWRKFEPYLNGAFDELNISSEAPPK